MAQFKTLQFPNTPQGQALKVQTLQVETSRGWRVVSETIVPGKFRGGQACCLFLIFAPCAFLAGHTDDVINVTLSKEGGNAESHSSEASHVPTYDRKKWDALLRYDKDVAAAAGQVRLLGSRQVDELAIAYLTLNETRYLPEIVKQISERAEAEAALAAARLAEQEEKNRIALEAANRLAEERQERIQQRWDILWGTNQRRLWTVGIAIFLLLVVSALAWIGIESISSSAFSTRVGGVEGKVVITLPPDSLQTAGLRPSFDCSKVRSQVPTLICATPELSIEDQRLSTAYASALVVSRSPRALKASERRWIVRRNSAVANEELLRKMYQARIRFLEAITDTARKSGGE